MGWPNLEIALLGIFGDFNIDMQIANKLLAYAGNSLEILHVSLGLKCIHLAYLETYVAVAPQSWVTSSR